MIFFGNYPMAKSAVPQILDSRPFLLHRSVRILSRSIDRFKFSMFLLDVDQINARQILSAPEDLSRRSLPLKLPTPKYSGSFRYHRGVYMLPHSLIWQGVVRKSCETLGGRLDKQVYAKAGKLSHTVVGDIITSFLVFSARRNKK